jgi:hypothetical protein
MSRLVPYTHAPARPSPHLRGVAGPGKVALVTGGDWRIDQELVAQLEQYGFRVVVNARNAAALQTTVHASRIPHAAHGRRASDALDDVNIRTPIVSQFENHQHGRKWRIILHEALRVPSSTIEQAHTSNERPSVTRRQIRRCNLASTSTSLALSASCLRRAR